MKNSKRVNWTKVSLVATIISIIFMILSMMEYDNVHVFVWTGITMLTSLWYFVRVIKEANEPVQPKNEYYNPLED